jgi:hypothetical protein
MLVVGRVLEWDWERAGPLLCKLKSQIFMVLFPGSFMSMEGQCDEFVAWEWWVVMPQRAANPEHYSGVVDVCQT